MLLHRLEAKEDTIEPKLFEKGKGTSKVISDPEGVRLM
jgi:hypothetical protein